MTCSAPCDCSRPPGAHATDVLVPERAHSPRAPVHAWPSGQLGNCQRTTRSNEGVPDDLTPNRSRDLCAHPAGGGGSCRDSHRRDRWPRRCSGSERSSYPHPRRHLHRVPARRAQRSCSAGGHRGAEGSRGPSGERGDRAAQHSTAASALADSRSGDRRAHCAAHRVRIHRGRPSWPIIVFPVGRHPGRGARPHRVRVSRACHTRVGGAVLSRSDLAVRRRAARCAVHSRNYRRCLCAVSRDPDPSALSGGTRTAPGLLRWFHGSIWGSLALHVTINATASSAIIGALFA